MFIRLLLVCLLLVQTFGVCAQLSIELGPNAIALNQEFSVTIASEGAGIRQFSKFPDIEGFTKAGRTSSTSSVSVAGGQTVIGQRMTQNYRPSRQGIFRLRPFSIRVNGQSVDSKGATITVGPAIIPDSTALPEPVPAPLTGLPEEDELAEKAGNAFLSLSTSKKTVFIGEALEVGLYFYLPFAERHLFEFYNFSNELPALIKQVKQANVWEEHFDQYQIEPEHLDINGKPFLRFKLYQAVYFPLTTEPLLFPSLGLKMVKYKISTQPSAVAPGRIPELETLYSRPLIVEVKELPPHPMRDKVAVGRFRLTESTSKTQYNTGKGFRYLFHIEGEGNLANLAPPQITWPGGLTAYEPTIKQNIYRSAGRVTGSKTFVYFITPLEPGTYRFGNFAHWIYFDPERARYDTLQADLSIQVTGPSSKNAAIEAADLGEFYQSINTASNSLQSLEDFDRIKLYANLVLLALLLVLLFIYLKK